MIATPLALHHAPMLHSLYTATPGYFALLGSRVPTLGDVEREIEIALLDHRRALRLLHDDHGDLVGALDCKNDYPQPGDVTINLLLIREDRQSQRLGEQAVQYLERHVPPGTNRILASVLGENPRGARFWERLGYTFTLDARPAMTWYAKPVTTRPHQSGGPRLGVASD